MNLSEYRQEMRRIAVLRDGNFCMICKWTHGITTTAQAVHHVFGRGASIDSVREWYTSLMCVCNACHPWPILIPPGDDRHIEVLRVWKSMNVEPVVNVHGVAEFEVKNPVGLETFKVSGTTPDNWR